MNNDTNGVYQGNRSFTNLTSHKEEDEICSITSELEGSLNLSNINDNRSNVSGSNNRHDSNYLDGNNVADEEALNIAKAESLAVFRIRLIVLAVLLFSTVGVSLIVYYFTHSAEVNDFERKFKDNSAKVLAAIGSSLDLMQSVADEFAVALVSYAAYSQTDDWPFVTLPDFGVRAAKARSLSSAMILAVYPYVTDKDRAKWEEYAPKHDIWVNQSLAVQAQDPTYHGTVLKDFSKSFQIYNDSGPVPPPGPYLPTWQSYPVVPYYPPYNWDLHRSRDIHESVQTALDKQQVVIGLTSNIGTKEQNAGTISWIKGYVGEGDTATEPLTAFYYPILHSAAEFVRTSENKGKNQLVGLLALTMFWRELMKNVLPQGSDGTCVVIGNSCGQSFSYRIDGPTTTYLGKGDLHDHKYNYLGVSTQLVDINSFASGEQTYSGIKLNEDFCPYWVSVYPLPAMEDQLVTKKPIVFTVAVIIVFLFTSAVFFVYDCIVEKRQQKVMKTAMQTSAIVSSLFPSVVRDRLFPKETAKETKREKGLSGFLTPRLKLQSFLQDGVVNKATPEELDEITSPPIAELFTDTTVLFSDIAGFTAWSSVREPAQVFTLLESIYSAFDFIAKQRGVFKVETIGDSYVAVAGLPKPRRDHAVVMARFARDCRDKMTEVTQKLEITLGPDTGDLKLRFGLNSGPVTAGVLRGERSRFQLFGDTVNTASRMESTGVAGKIQVSQTTADELKLAGKEHWLVAREDLVVAKGKGSMQTYWVEPKSGSGSASHSSTPSSNFSEMSRSSSSNNIKIDNRVKRLVDWNVDLLQRQLKQVMAHRACAKRIPRTMARQAGSTRTLTSRNKDNNNSSSSVQDTTNVGTVLDEVKEIIELPKFDDSFIDVKFVEAELSVEVKEQLHQFVLAIAAMYRDNPFHNFEHASHVTMSVSKLMARIVTPDELIAEDFDKNMMSGLATLHDHTYGITSDPLTHFACLFAALIHDVDHPGVSNAQLVKENDPVALAYRGKSVAEQNSVDLAWELFLDDQFVDLRAAVCSNAEEMKRFRQLIVNMVMATDIMDQDLKNLRNARWQKAFASNSSINSIFDYNGLTESEYDQINRKATIVIEHLIQASDVAHTMQHWHIYRKWNERLFLELYQAYLDGRAEKNPVEFWYQGELNFFDYYIIPLAKKLHDCGVFGVSSDEYLNYAKKNREEWEARGQEVVVSLIEKLG